MNKAMSLTLGAVATLVILGLATLIAASDANLQLQAPVGTGPHAGRCHDYTYSTCPDGCAARCVPSYCHYVTDSRGRRMVCTTDCEGPGSCVVP